MLDVLISAVVTGKIDVQEACLNTKKPFLSRRLLIFSA